MDIEKNNNTKSECDQHNCKIYSSNEQKIYRKNYQVSAPIDV